MLGRREAPELAPVRPGTVALVAVGGALGAAARYLVSVAMASGSGFPWGTLLVNVLGAFALAALMGAVVERRPTSLLRPFLGVGVLGGFTTFSTLSLEAIGLWNRGEHGLAAAYVCASVAGGLTAAAAGERLGRRSGGPA